MLAAAERATGLPKATLSRRLAALERELDVQLLSRAARGVAPTEAGRALYDRAQAAFAAMEEAVAEASGDGHAHFGQLRLSLPPDLAAALLEPALIQF